MKYSFTYFLYGLAFNIMKIVSDHCDENDSSVVTISSVLHTEYISESILMQTARQVTSIPSIDTLQFNFFNC